MKKFIGLIACMLAISLLCACESKNEECTEHVIYGMDTYITLKLSPKKTDGDSIDEDETSDIENKCSEIIAKNEILMSSHNTDAVIYGLNHGVAQINDADAVLTEVLKSAIDISERTDGAFNPASGALTELWNVTGGGPVPSDDDISKALEHISPECITVDGDTITKSDPDCLIDLGGIGKGYTAQSLVEYLSSRGIGYGLVSVGGNVGVFGDKGDGAPFRIGICDPDNTSDVMCYLNISGGFVSVSGDYERYFEQDGKRYHHIIDMSTGYPADSFLRSVAVWAQNGAMADALSTALFVMGVESGCELYHDGDISFEAIFITDSGDVVLTDGLKNGAVSLNSDKYSITD